ncbi:DUF6085 family protein [Streptomyces sp. ME02-7008A-1]|uniref:hypothetical protein n=1 Tax=unclassified Streptomyces TaxID=2593676 RepID=UPI0029A472ED|nr:MULTISPECIES: hypothetical protein [unclassified Streptomyces]MDX3183476.1 DUF6085 family protein [Streptomyces sp. ME02-7008A-1]MDX3303928.1 DUF6085 family protein [Streptomyces sp. ME02-7008A]
MSDDAGVAKAITEHAEHLAHIPPSVKARAVNAVGPALQARGEWLRLSTRQAVASAVLVAVKADLEARAGLPDVAGSCPACGAASLFLGEGGHVTCSRIDCSDPSATDELLRGGEEALVQALGGDRTARLIAYNLHCHGHSLADVRRMTDEEFRAVPGIGDTSLATIRRAFPAQSPSRAGDILAALGRRVSETLAKGLDRDNYALAPASEPPVVATARFHVDATADPSTHTPRCSCGQTTQLLSVDSAGAHWHEDDPAVPVPSEAFDRLVRVAMWVSRGQAMAHVPDPQLGGGYPDAAARAALGALDDAGLLDTCQQTVTEETPDA